VSGTLEGRHIVDAVLFICNLFGRCRLILMVHYEDQLLTVK
jgi:hypothetical protein